MKFQGTLLPIGTLLSRARATDAGPPAGGEAHTSREVRHTARGNARRCSELIRKGEPLDSVWRFGILQTLDDYRSTVARGGVSLGAAVFDAEPAPTGSAEIDAAFAALAEYLAEQDGWRPPSWLTGGERVSGDWYPAVPDIFREEAEAFSPRAFRSRGIYITPRSLARA